MRQDRIMAAFAISFFLFAGIPGNATEQKQGSGVDVSDKKEGPAPAGRTPEAPQITLKVPFASPLFSECPVAKIKDETITMSDLSAALASSHEKRTDRKKEEGKEAQKIDYSMILKRMVNVRLIIQEARNIGLDELPEVKEPMAEFLSESLRDFVVEESVKDIKPEEHEIEKLYRKMVKEWKIKSVMFTKEDDAKTMKKELEEGKNFDELVTKALDDKRAEGSQVGSFLKEKELVPEIAGVVSKMEAGEVSSIITIHQNRKDPGYVVLKVEEVRFPENEEARERAATTVLEAKKAAGRRNFKVGMSEKYAKIDLKLVKTLDYESQKPGIEKLSNDKRTIVRIKGEKPVTVGDLSKAIKDMYFHGVQEAVKSKKQINLKKLDVLYDILLKRLLTIEALSQGLDKSGQYKKLVRNYEDSLLFGMFIQKVIEPDIKVSQEEEKAYHEEHAKDFTYPEMIKIDSIVFQKVNDAESTLAKLREGADFRWLKANMEGQVAKDSEGLLSLDGSIVMAKELPEGVRNAVSGTRAEDLRLYQSPQGHFYILYVQDVVPSIKEPFETAEAAIAQKIYNEKLNKSVEEWAEKLRESIDVKIYLAEPEKEKDTQKTN